ASPFELEPGQSAELRWRVRGATSVQLETPSGTIDVATEGTRTMTFEMSTTLHLIAMGEGGMSRSATQVTIIDPLEVEIVRFDVTPMRAAENEAVMISW